MIPALAADPGDYGYFQLPPGIHVATWQELAERFGSNARRREVLTGLLRALRALKAAGCRRAYVDGSFVTSKEAPGDFDGCWDHDGVDFDVLDPVLLDFDGHREAQKAKFGGEMFIADAPGNRFLEFFQMDRDGRPKGIIQINLTDIP